MQQLAIPEIIGHNILAELAAEYNALVDYRASLHYHPTRPWIGRDQALAEASLGTLREAMEVVARHCGLELSTRKRG